MSVVYCPLCTSNIIPTNYQIAYGIRLISSICAKCSEGEEE